MNSFQQQQTAIKGALALLLLLLLPELPGQPLFSLFVDLLLLSPLSCHYLITHHSSGALRFECPCECLNESKIL